MTAREQAAGTPRTTLADRAADRLARARLYNLCPEGEPNRVGPEYVCITTQDRDALLAERALSAELKERAEASEANAERLAAALEGLVRWAVGDKNMPAVMARESHPEHGETCALCIARAALAKARGEREV